MYSSQLNKVGGGGADDIDIYLRINGTNVANTGSRTSITAAVETMLTVSFIVSLSSTDVVELVAFTPAGVQCQLLAVPAAPPVPAILSIITDVQRIA